MGGRRFAVPPPGRLATPPMLPRPLPPSAVRRLAPFAILLVAHGAARPAAAQFWPRPGSPAPRPGVPRGAGNPADTVAPARWRHIAGVSPVHLLFGSSAGDYEQAVSRDVSLGVGATYSGPRSILTSTTSGGYDVDVSAKARYYLRGTAPEGASIGALVGFVHGRRDRRDEASSALAPSRRETAPAVGFTADYNYFVGSTRRVVLGTGYGLKRRFVTTRAADEYERFAEIQYTLRFLLGVAW